MSERGVMYRKAVGDSMPVKLEITLRQAAILRDVLQWHEPRSDWEPIAEQEALRMSFERVSGARAAVRDLKVPALWEIQEPG